MNDPVQEIEAVRADIAILRDLIDRALDKGAGATDAYLLACADLLYRRKKRLVELEAVTLYVSKGSDAD